MGLRNFELLINDIDSRICDEKVDRFSMFIFEVLNTDDINRYLDYEYGNNAIIKTISTAQQIFENDELYSVYTNVIAIILDNMSMSETHEKGNMFLKAFYDLVTIKDIPMNIIINGGIVSYPENGEKTDILYKNMKRTLSQCGNDCGVISLYDDRITNQIKENHHTKMKLYRAINNNELRIEYQPKYKTTTNEICGAEALLRWDGSDLCISEVIDIAEKTNLINYITKYVTKKVIEQLEEWKQEGIITKVSINVSPKDLSNDFFLDYLLECVENSDIQPNMIGIEITEKSIAENSRTIFKLLNKIEYHGFDISIDDYGTGYNSLKNIFVFPFHNIKIDKFFIDNIENKGTYSLIEGIINTAKELNIGVIAEGVETETQYLILRNLGCEMIQGYYFGKPLRPEEFKITLMPTTFDIL